MWVLDMRTQLVRLGGKCLYSLSHLANPQVEIKISLVYEEVLGSSCCVFLQKSKKVAQFP